MAKIAQAALTKIILEENKGVVHVAQVIISGVVGDKEELNNPTNIASKFWELYEQKRGSWKFEIGV